MYKYIFLNNTNDKTNIMRMVLFCHSYYFKTYICTCRLQLNDVVTIESDNNALRNDIFITEDTTVKLNSGTHFGDEKTE